MKSQKKSRKGEGRRFAEQSYPRIESRLERGHQEIGEFPQYRGVQEGEEGHLTQNKYRRCTSWEISEDREMV